MSLNDDRDQGGLSSLQYSRKGPEGLELMEEGAEGLPVLEELGFSRAVSQVEEELPEAVQYSSAKNSNFCNTPIGGRSTRTKAKRLASVLSRVQYAMEDDIHATPAMRPPPRADYWKTSVESNAQKVRNKLGLRSQCLSIYRDLGYVWDPLQIIRNRKARNHSPPKGNMWEIRVSEIYNDIMWLKHRVLVDSSSPTDAAPNEGRSSPQSSTSSPEIMEPSTPPPDKTEDDWCWSSVKTPTLLTPSAQKHVGGLQSRSSELIERLQSRHITDNSSQSGDDMVPAHPKFSRKSSGHLSSRPSLADLSNAEAMHTNTENGLLAPPVQIGEGRHMSSGSIGTVSSESNMSDRLLQTESSSHRSSSSPSAPVDFDLSHYSCFKRPEEANCNNAEAAELEFMCTVLRELLRRIRYLCKSVESKVVPPTCDIYRVQVKREIVPKYLEYLAAMEKTAIDNHHQLDQEVVGALDSLMVVSDMMSSEVNTTLNRQLRETSAQLDHLCSSHQQCLMLNIGFGILEYLMVGIMWTYWAIVTFSLNLARTVSASYSFASWACLI